MNPFSNIDELTISSHSETKIIAMIKNWLGSVNPPSPQGIGDDCAVLPSSGKKQLITTDGVIYGRHFDDKATAESVGEKLIKRNVSDIAAMGGNPGEALIALSCGSNLKLQWLESFYKGIKLTCEKYNIKLIGGDLSQNEDSHFTAYLTLIGYHDAPILRTGAQVNDKIYVTGTLGGSISGRHLSFEPRLKEGNFLSHYNGIHSMIDISDGLGKDLLSLLVEDQIALLDLEKIPISNDANELSRKSGKTPLAHAFSDGEDYELLFTFDGKKNEAQFMQEWYKHFKTQLTLIGRIDKKTTDKQSALLNINTHIPIEYSSGYEHFKISNPQ
jgi:thiamine-monophosphate kinase